MFERLMGRHRGDGDSDAELHQDALKGNGDAMAALYRRHGGLVYRFTLRMSRDETIAEEVTQEVFLALLSQLDRFDPQKAALGTWLCAIARRQLWKHMERFDQPTAIEEDVPDAESLGESFDSSPVTGLIRQEAVTAMRQALDELALPLREVIVLCELEELSYKQAALVLAVPIGTVRSRLHRAKAKLALRMRGSMAAAGTEKERR